MLLKQKTNKLFYNKWPYKITCKVEGAHLIRLYKFKILASNFVLKYNYTQKRIIDLQELKNFLSLSKSYFENKEVKTRINYNYVDFYVLSKDEFDQVAEDLKKYVIGFSEPSDEEDLKILLENKKYNLCNQLPHGKYRYKVTFKDMSPKIRNDLITWAEKYNNDDIYITKSTRNYFKSLKHHYGSHYFYVKDQKMITLISLAAGGNIRRTEEYIVRIPKEEA